MEQHPLHHPLNDGVDDDGLWDELSNQQSREIQQHQYRMSSQRPGTASSGASNAIHDSNTTTASAATLSLQHMMEMTAGKLRSAATSLANATYYQPIPHHHHTVTPTNLDDFGLPRTPDDDPLLPQQTDYGYYDATPATTTKDQFVLLRPFRFLPKRDGWEAVANLDLFFTSLYNYYYHRGLVPILAKGIVELISLVVTLWLSVFLFAYVDWRGLSHCTDEATCHAQFSDYLVDKPLTRISLWNFLVILYCILFTCYTVFYLWGFLHTIRDALEARDIFEERLGIPQHKLEGGAIDWDRDVVSKIVQLQQSGEYRVAIHGEDLDALVVAQRILRKENFVIALFNRRMLDLTVPIPILKGTMFFCKSLEWSLYFCILNYMFNHKYQIRPAFYLDPSSLKRRFILCGICHAVFMPFLLFFMTLHFFMQNVYDMKSSKQYLGPREWTLSAKWIFREFNELPHFFERRLEPSYVAAENYLKLFTQSEILTSIGRLLVFVGGSLGAILVAFAALNDAILLHVKIGDWNLLWYVGMLGVMYSGGKALQPSSEFHQRYIRNLFGEMEATLAQVATHTHHLPDVWKARSWDNETKKEVSAMFQYKAQLFLLEVVSVILAPIILCISLPKCAEHICEFVLASKSEVPGAGEVCGYSTFNFDAFGDDNWEGRTMGSTGNSDSYSVDSDLNGSVSASVLQTKNVDAATKLHPKPKARHGKMEKSFFSFKATHPSWRSTESGQELVNKLETYKNDEAMAMARERQHHIEAAARQLETLAHLEQTKQSSLWSMGENRVVNEAYITKDSESGRQGEGNAVISSEDPLHVAHQPMQLGGDRDDLPPFASPELPTGPPLPPTAPRARGPPVTRSPNGGNPAAALSVLHYADLGLSTELRRILNRSTLDPDLSTMGSVLGGVYDPSLSATVYPGRPMLPTDGLNGRELDAERQYQLLERYHAHVAGQRRPRAPVNSTGTRSMIGTTRTDTGYNEVAQDLRSSIV